jgi:cation diffusion facilitator CzcD-associated flavoprotein CzcO
MNFFPPSEHFDVVVVGAGISGIGAAWHLRSQCPEQSFVVLESKPTFGGTWVTHRYPGIRSDSELYTFGYRFKPWIGPPIASGAEILDYLRETIRDAALEPRIRYRHTILAADWSGDDKRWHLRVRREDSGELLHLTAGFLWMCQGYYRHDEGYTPEWPGMAEFAGRIVHPQTWPADLELKQKRVVVIGSGATAATLIPAIADETAHTTMLQRSPTYFLTGRNINELADMLRSLEIPQAWTHEIVRRKAMKDQAAFQARARAEPETVKREMLDHLRTVLGDSDLVDAHFTPRYRPWQQRVAFVPEADLFQAIKRGKASVVTDEIERFTRAGLLLKSGQELPADVIVTATGFHLSAMGEIPFSVDGKRVDFHDTVTWRGAMFTGVPNLLWVFGYLRWAWTLRVDLMGDLMTRLLGHMRQVGAKMVVPQLRPSEQSMPLAPWVTPDSFNPGYLTRGMHLMPQQGNAQPWLHTQDYRAEKEELPVAPLDDGTLLFR